MQYTSRLLCGGRLIKTTLLPSGSDVVCTLHSLATLSRDSNLPLRPIVLLFRKGSRVVLRGAQESKRKHDRRSIEEPQAGV